MKKKMALALLAMMAVSMLSGCGKNQVNPLDGGDTASTVATVATESSQEYFKGIPIEEYTGEKRILKDVDTSQYVVLGEYKNIPVSVASSTVTDEDVEMMALNFYQQNITAENGGIVDREVQDGDTICLDYCGKMNDEAFQGGTATGATLTIGSHTFIDGFEEQLVGTKPGDDPNLDLTFPEDYYNTDLAGQAVVFEVKVNYIVPTEMEDEVVKNFELDEFSDVAGLRQYVREYLELNAQNDKENSIQSTVLNYVMNNFEIKAIPGDLLQNYKENIEKSISEMAAQYGVDADTYCSYYYGMTLEAFLADYAPQAVQQNLICQAIANAENLNMSDEDLDAQLQTYADMSGVTIEEMLGDEDKEDYREYFMFQRVMEFLSENAAVTEQ